ncbi:MAG: transposase, partial [Treponema sp.]|nr:transposase [Treponema sp.]
PEEASGKGSGNIGSAEIQYSDDDQIFEREKCHKNTPGSFEGNERVTNKDFWTRGYCVSTVGLNEEQIREYIKNQEELDKGRQGLLNLDGPEIN